MHAPRHASTYNNWFSWLGWLSYSFQRVSLSDVKTRLLYLSAVILVNIFVGGCLYRCASGQSWGSSLFKTYGVLFRAPGVGVFAEETVAASLVLNVIFIFSLFVFAAFLGMISDEIKQQVRTHSSTKVLNSSYAAVCQVQVNQSVDTDPMSAQLQMYQAETIHAQQLKMSFANSILLLPAVACHQGW
jgi:hypothetical protein